MQPSDLTRIRTLSSPTVHPDGRDVVVAMSRPDVEDNRYRTSLWRQRLTADGSTAGAPERFTHSTRDSNPAYSPDGSHLAFLRAGEEGPAQLHVIPADGGDARRLTDTTLGVGAFAWSPDGGRIAYAARVPEEGRYGTDEKVKPDQEAPRLIEHSTYLADGLGYVLDRPSKIFVVDLDVEPDERSAPDAEDADELPESRQLTGGEGDDRQPVFLDGGQRIGFIASRDGRGTWRPDTLVSDLCSVDLRGKGFRRHTSGTGSVSSVHVAADGAVVYGANDLGPSGQDFVARNAVLHRLSATGTTTEESGLTDPEEDHLACAPALGVGGTLVAAVERRGDTLVRDVDTGQTLLDGHVSVTGLAVGGGVVVAVAGTRTSYSELFVGRVGERLTQVTDLGATHLTGTAAPIEPEELQAGAEDGYPVHGWLFRPTATARTKAGHPVVLMIHGGPYTQYTGNLFDEAQVLAGAGYAVVMGNPRGGSGYGATHGRAVKEAIGTVDVADLTALLDHALTRPGLDGSRVGVQGGSYGGLMTTWMVAHSDRFTAAISERAVNAWDSFAGTSDIGWFFGDEYVGELAHEQSPLTWADQIRTPTLVMHSERDFRCPLEQGQRLFARLRRNGVPTKLLVFPGEGHELTRTGQPRHRVQRFEHILGWWAEYLR